MFLGVLDMSLRAPIDWYKLLGAIFKSQKVDLTPITLYMYRVCCCRDRCPTGSVRLCNSS
jgi:hypothetical protein